MTLSLAKVGDHYCWSWDFSNIWAGQTSPEWKFSLSSFISWVSIFILKSSIWLLFHLMIWYFKFLLRCLFPPLIYLFSRLPLLLEKRLSLLLLLQPISLLEGLLYSWEGRAGHILDFYLVCLLWPVPCSQLSFWCPWNTRVRNLRIGLCFTLTWFSLGS